jgi:hypothetical protein
MNIYLTLPEFLLWAISIFVTYQVTWWLAEKVWREAFRKWTDEVSAQYARKLNEFKPQSDQ